MTHQLKPIAYSGPQAIIITEEQIIGAAQKIVNAYADDACEYSEAQIIAAVETWLRCVVNDHLVDADWHANRDGFDFSKKFIVYGTPDEATELNIPAVV